MEEAPQMVTLAQKVRDFGKRAGRCVRGDLAL